MLAALSRGDTLVAQTVEKRRENAVETRFPCPPGPTRRSDVEAGRKRRLMHIYGYHERHNCEVYFIKWDRLSRWACTSSVSSTLIPGPRVAMYTCTRTHTHTHIWREEDSLSNPRFSPRLSRYVRDLFSVPFSHLFLPRYICPSSFDSLPPSPPRIYTHARFNPLCDDEQYSTRKLWHRRRRQVYIRRTDLSDILLNEGRGADEKF